MARSPLEAPRRERGSAGGPLRAEQVSEDALAAALGERPFRTYVALLSTEADALAWARAGAPDGAIVAAGYQAAPRGRGGIAWDLSPKRDLCFSMILRPSLAPEREGWLYAVATSALADVLGEDAAIAWPDEVLRGGAPAGAVGVQAGMAPRRVEWAVLTLSVLDAPVPWAPLIARIADSVEGALKRPADELLAGYRRRCTTLGRSVRVRVTGVGAHEGTFAGRAARLRRDGSLVIETQGDRRVAVRPQHLWELTAG